MKKFAAAVVAAGALLVPGAALANSTQDTYSSNVGSVKNTGASRSNTPSTAPASGTKSSSPNTVSSVDSENATRSASSASSELPFTGIDIAPLAAGGALLLGAGLFVRRLSSENN